MLVAVFLTFGTVSVFAKDKGKEKDTTSQVSGTSTGTSTVTNPPTSPTDPNGCAPNTGGGKVCHFDVSGTFTASPLGTGTYAGKVTLDYHSYTATNRCATASGTITFTNTATGDKLYTMIDPTRSNVCETATPTIHSEDLVLIITGGTGQFAGATGTIMSKGTTIDAEPGMHTDSATLTGSITLEHGNNGHGCGNDGHDNGKGNGGDDNGNGHCGSDHGDGHDDNGGDNQQVT